MLETLLLRSLLIWRTRRAERLRDVWQPLLVESLDGSPNQLPSLPRRDVFSFLLLWNYLQDSLRDEAHENLNRVARQIGIDQQAFQLLEQGNLRRKLIAIQTLGWLREKQAWNKLLEIADDDDPVLSLTAAKALLRIDGALAVESIIEFVKRRDDWSTAMVAGMLSEAGADLISAPLARAALETPLEHAPRMIHFLELAHAEIALPVVHQMMERSTEMEIITACLRVLQNPEDLPIVRQLLKDERWQIRLQAAVFLGRTGTHEDEARLAHACGDLEWWVRYRAAQALAHLPSMSAEHLSEIAESHFNEFARDIIRQVIAERQVLQQC